MNLYVQFLSPLNTGKGFDMIILFCFVKLIPDRSYFFL